MTASCLMDLKVEGLECWAAFMLTLNIYAGFKKKNKKKTTTPVFFLWTLCNGLFLLSWCREINATAVPRRALQPERKTLYFKMTWTDTHTHKHTHTHTQLVDLASFQHLELKHCHLVLCSVYFWTHRWSFAIFRCTVKVDETLGQRLMFTLLNVLMSRLLRVETLHVSSGRASEDTLSLWTTVFFFLYKVKKTKHTLLQTHCCSARLFSRSSTLIWNIFIVLSLHHQEQQETVIMVAAFFFFFFLKKCFCIDNKGTLSVQCF